MAENIRLHVLVDIRDVSDVDCLTRRLDNALNEFLKKLNNSGKFLSGSGFFDFPEIKQKTKKGNRSDSELGIE